MGRGDIRAGGAFIELGAKDAALTKALRAASAKLKSFGAGVATIGAGISAAGAAITAPFGAALETFMSTGDELDKMRQRTGISVEALSELGHAADQSGASLADVEASTGKMQKNLTEAAGGASAARDAFIDLGLSVEELKNKTPEEQFMAVAQAIGQVKDPAERAAKAMAVMGKSATKLLPMIEDLDALREEARKMGFTMSGESAASAVKLGDMLANLWKTVKFGAIAIGDALAPALTTGVKLVQQIATKALEWVKANKSLFVTIAAVGAGLLAAGAAITGLGLAITVIGTALGGIATAIGVLGTVLGVVLSPIGLVVAALAGAVYAWTQFTESGQATTAEISRILGEIAGTFRTTFGGIVDAIKAGELELAFKIAWAGVKTVWHTAIGALNAVWQEWKAFVLEVVNQVHHNIAAVFVNLVADIQSTWAGLIGWFGDMFVGLEAMAKKASVSLATGLGKAAIYVQEKLGKLTAEQANAARALLDVSSSGAKSTIDQERNKELGQRSIDRGKELARIEDERKGTLGEVEKDRQRESSGIEASKQGALAQDRADLASAQAELDRLREQAAAARAAAEAADAENADKNKQAAEGGDGTQLKKDIFGSFSAAALAANGGSTNPMLAEQKTTNTKLDGLATAMERQTRVIEAAGALT